MWIKLLFFGGWLMFSSIHSFAQQPRLVLPIGHDDWVEIAWFSPDNKYIISSSDKELIIWDAASKHLLVRLTDHTRKINTIAFSPDGRYFVTAANDSTAKIWDVKTATLLHSVKDSSGGIKNASFSPDGKFVITHTNKSIKTWDAYTGKPVLDITERSWEHPASAVFSPDGKYILKGGDYKSTIFESSTGKLVKILDDRDKPHRYENIFASYSHNGKWILSAGDKTPPKLWNPETGKIVTEFKGHEDEVIITAFSPDDKLLLTVSEFNEPPKIWDVTTGNMIAQLVGHTKMIQSAKFSPDGNKIVTSSWDGTAKVWDAYTGKLLLDLNRHSDNLYFASFSSNGKMIVTASADETVKLWDAESGELTGDMKGHTMPLGKSFESMTNDTMYSIVGKKLIAWDTYKGSLSGSLLAQGNWISAIARTTDGKLLATGNNLGTVRLWDAKTHSLLSSWEINKKHIYDLSFSGDDKYLAIASHDSIARVLDAKTGHLIAAFKNNDLVMGVALSNTGNQLLTMSHYKKTARAWSTQNKTLLFELGHGDDVHDIAFSPDGKYIVSCSGNYLLPTSQGLKVWDASSGKLITEYIKNNEWGFEMAIFPPGAKDILAYTIDGRIFLWNYQKKSKWKFLNKGSEKERIQQVSFSPDQKYIVSASVDHSAKIWKRKNGKLMSTLTGHTDYVNAALFTPDGKYVITASGDNSSKKWNAKTGELLCTFLVIDSTDYFTQIPSGYYQCSSNAAKLLHYVTKDLKFITFEQLDVKYNRPDKVLEAIGNMNTVLINSYRKAYEKRIKKLGIDTTQFRDGYSVPEADFVNRDIIEYEQKNVNLTLHIKGNDSTYKLDRFNVWVNEAPIYGQRGISIRERNKNDFDTTIIIKLSQGENRIETSITNVNGTESYRMPLTVNYTPAVRQKEMTRFIGIGIDKFSDNQYNLQYSAKDIRDLADSLKNKYKDNIVIDTLFNENVTIANVKALKQKLQTTTVNDKVIIAYSGHGMLSKDYDYYLSTYFVNFENPEQNGLPYEELENLLDSIPARKKLMLIDACHSGEVDKEDLERLNGSSDSLKKGFKPVAYKKNENHLGLKNSFELMQSLFVNVGKSTGATIISAAGGTQFALERNDLKNGVFTYSILEAMKQYPEMKISELKKIVGQRVEQLTKGLQKPTSRNETIAVDWNVW